MLVALDVTPPFAVEQIPGLVLTLEYPGTTAVNLDTLRQSVARRPVSQMTFQTIGKVAGSQASDLADASSFDHTLLRSRQKPSTHASSGRLLS